MINPRLMLSAALGYVRKNPDEVVRQATKATGLTFGVPLASLRWLAGHLTGKKAPKDIEILSAAPALRLSAVVDAVGTSVRASAAIKVEDVTLSPDSIRIAVRLRDVKLALAGDSNESPVATLIQSGVLDLSKPGNLLKFIPKKPLAIVEADGDRIVVDLMKIPQVASDVRFRKVLSILSPVLGIRSIETDRDHLWVKLRATPSGLPEAIAKLRGVK